MTFKERYKKERADFAEFMKWYPFTLEDLDGEDWADIEGYEGRYQISTFGRVKSLPRKHKRTPKILRPKLDKKNYLMIEILSKRQRKPFKIHRLVAQAFIPNPNNKPQVNHIDGCKINAYVGNLEWATNAENQRHAYVTGLNVALQGEDKPQAKLNNEQVRYIRDNPENLKTIELAQYFGVNKTTIERVKFGRTFKMVGGKISQVWQCEEHFNSKLTNKQALYIRDNPEKLNTVELAKMFGVSKSTISNIQIGKNYKTAGGRIRQANKISPRLPDDVRERIRTEYIKGSKEFGCYGLGEKYGVTPTTICNIIHEK